MAHGAYDHHGRRVFQKASADALQQLEAIHARQNQLRDQRVIMPCAQRIERCLPIRHGLKLRHLFLRRKAVPHCRLKLKVAVRHENSIFCHSYASFLQSRCNFCLQPNHTTAIFAAIEHEFGRYCRVLLCFKHLLSLRVSR